MAIVFQIVAYNVGESIEETAGYNLAGSSLVDDLWHCALSYGGLRTVCGIQLDGEDCITEGPNKKGFVTCPTCLGIIDEIKLIRKYKPKIKQLKQARWKA